MFHLLLHDLVSDFLAQRGEAAPVIDPGPFNKDQDMVPGPESGTNLLAYGNIILYIAVIQFQLLIHNNSDQRHDEGIRP